MFKKKDPSPTVHMGTYRGAPQRIEVTNPRSKAYGRTGVIVRDEGTWVSARMDGDRVKLYRLSNSEYKIL